MGSWGTGLYSNDISCDVRDMCNDVYPLVGIEKGTQLILEEYADIVNGDIIDNDYAGFWFALADWQWKHGILTDKIKNKTISLLETHTGIEEWEETGNATDIKKRLAVMDKLLQQLKAPQPEIKIPKAKITKPKHKPGDIIIVRTGLKENDPENWIWNIKTCADPYVYVPEIANKVAKEICPPYEAYDKYIAILCVGTEKLPHSQYVDGIFDEYSVYSFYDYISNEKPTIEQLKQCGFLPKLVMYGKEQGSGISTLEWRYKFILSYYSFRVGKDNSEQNIEKYSCLSESERFHSLFLKKNYSLEDLDEYELFQAFNSFFEERTRLSLAGIEYDNLLDTEKINPPLRSKEEVAKMIVEEIKKEMQDLGLNN